VQADSPAAYWHLEEASGTSTSDFATGSYPGTFVNSPTLRASGALSNGTYGVTLNGTSQYITTGYVQTSVTAYTLECWIKTASTASMVMVSDRGSGAGISVTLAMSAGKPFVGIDSNSIIDKITYSGSSIADGSWHHVVGTWAAASGTATSVSQLALYIDGIAVSTTASNSSSSTSPLTGLGGTVIGYHQAWGQYFDGSIDEVAIYTTQLSAGRIQAHYTAR
jgi:hypothetical protein